MGTHIKQFWVNKSIQVRIFLEDCTMQIYGYCISQEEAQLHIKEYSQIIAF